jgi:hypothetical protein
MKHIQKAFALSGLLVLLTFASALGQSDRQIIYIPFNFTVGENTFSAGKYSIEPNRRDTDTVWVIRAKNNSEQAFLLTRPVYSTDPQEKFKLVFHQYGDLYFLTEIWTAGNSTGRELQNSNQEKALNKGLAMLRQDRVLVADSK